MVDHDDRFPKKIALSTDDSIDTENSSIMYCNLVILNKDPIARNFSFSFFTMNIEEYIHFNE